MIALGLPDEDELAWRFQDSMIDVTKGSGREQELDQKLMDAIAWIRSPRR